MASNREAFKLTPVIAFGTEIECATYWDPGKGDSFFVFGGLGNGRVMKFRVIEDQATGRMRQEAILTQRVGKKRVDQIQAVGDIGKLFVLCDGSLTVHDLEDLQQDADAPPIKGVVRFALNEKGPPLYELCAASKRKLSLFSIAPRVKHQKDLAVPDAPVALSWYGTSICTAYAKREYSMINVRDGLVVDVPVAVDGKTRPLAKVVGPEEILLVGHESVGFFIRFDGTPAPRSTINWSQAPCSLSFCHPYVLALVPGVGIEVHNVRDQRLVQVLEAPEGTSLVDAPFLGEQGVQSVSAGAAGEGGGPAGGDTSSRILCVGKQRVPVQWVRPVPPLQQVLDLIRAREMEEAKEIFTHVTASATNQRLRRRFHTLVGAAQLLALEFGPGWKALLQGDVDPSEVVRLFPHLCSSRHAPGSSSSVPPAEVLAPGLGEGGIPDRAPPNELPKPSKVLPEAAASAEHGGAATAQNLIAAVLERRAKASSESGTRSSGSPEGVTSLLRAAEAHLTTALEGARPRFAKTESAAEVVEGALLRLYLRQSPDKLLKLVASPGSLAVEDTEQALLEGGRFHELAVFYRTKGLLPQALRCWRLLGVGEEKQEGRDGVEPTVEALSGADAMEGGLIWTYAQWLIDRAPDAALRVFLRNTACEPDRVLEFLPSFRAQTSSGSAPEPSPAARQLRQRYLEAMLALPTLRGRGTEGPAQGGPAREGEEEGGGEGEEEGEETEGGTASARRTGRGASVRSILGSRWSRDVLLFEGEASLGPRLPDAECPARVAHSELFEGASADRYHDLLAEELMDRAEALMLLRAEQHTRTRGNDAKDIDAQIAEARKELQHGLALSDQYKTGPLLQRARRAGLHKECVLMYGKQGQHHDALRLLLIELGDVRAAERYCDHHGGAGGGEDPTVSMLRIIFHDAALDARRRKTLHDAAMRMIRSRAEVLDAAEVLSVLPENTPLASVTNFLERSMTCASHAYRHGQVLRNLHKGEHLDVRTSLAANQRHYSVVTHATRCAACGKRIDAQMSFVRFPNGVLAHWQCVNDKLDRDPVTGLYLTDLALQMGAS